MLYKRKFLVGTDMSLRMRREEWRQRFGDVWKQSAVVFSEWLGSKCDFKTTENNIHVGSC
jgi:hypothetical protein